MIVRRPHPSVAFAGTPTSLLLQVPKRSSTSSPKRARSCTPISLSSFAGTTRVHIFQQNDNANIDSNFKFNPSVRRRVVVRSVAELEGESATPSVSASVPLSRTLRGVLGGLSLMGVFETLYLTWVKLIGTSGAICSTQGCIDVLTGPWSSFLGVPLSAYGMLAYGVFSFLSIWPLLARSETVYTDVDAGTTQEISADEVYVRRDTVTRGPMLALASVLVGFSTYLMSLLVWVIKDICPYCVFSAGLTLSIFVFMVTSRAMRTMPFSGLSKVISGGLGVSVVASVLSFSLAAPYIPQTPDSPQAPPTVTTYSSRQANRLADKLAKKNTKMYGAYWCTHCFDQKQKLGKQAWKKITYVECDKHGVSTQYKLCRQKRIPGYPTWEINGKYYPGEVLLEDLETIADEE